MNRKKKYTYSLTEMNEYDKMTDEIGIDATIPFIYFLFLLDRGHEFEFYYNHDIYFISNEINGRKLYGPSNDSDSDFYEDNIEFITNVKIDEKTLEEIFELETYTLETIF